MLSGFENGSIALKDVKSADFFALLLQNTQEGFFADPIYGGNRDMAGWKLVGFPARVTTIATGSSATTKPTRCLRSASWAVPTGQ